jgi:hypothetical protein
MAKDFLEGRESAAAAYRLLYSRVMNRIRLSPLALAALLLLPLAACTGGTETSAAEEQAPAEEASQRPGRHVDAQKALQQISPAIPLYQDAQFREDLTLRDEAMVKDRYGDRARVFTLATDDSFPQVFHYYTTYLAQFRSFPARDTYPPEKQWRTLEVKLNDAMRDPFIPGQALPVNGKQVLLQIAETEAEPKTIIRYIVTPPLPAAPPAPAVADGTAASAQNTAAR